MKSDINKKNTKAVNVALFLGAKPTELKNRVKVGNHLVDLSASGYSVKAVAINIVQQIASKGLNERR